MICAAVRGLKAAHGGLGGAKSRKLPAAGIIRHFLPYFVEQVWATNIWVNGWMDSASPLDTV
jgi:hypothetical protein